MDGKPSGHRRIEKREQSDTFTKRLYLIISPITHETTLG